MYIIRASTSNYVTIKLINYETLQMNLHNFHLFVHALLKYNTLKFHYT